MEHEHEDERAAWQHERAKDAERYAAREREWEAERRAHVVRVDAHVCSA